jgi:hypothetical protein
VDSRRASGAGSITVFKAAYGFPGMICPSLKQESHALKFLEIEKKE